MQPSTLWAYMRKGDRSVGPNQLKSRARGIIVMRDQGKRLSEPYEDEIMPIQLGPEPALDREIQARIGDKLRSMYDELLEQPVPDRFKELLDRLEKRGQE